MTGRKGQAGKDLAEPCKVSPAPVLLKLKAPRSKRGPARKARAANNRPDKMNLPSLFALACDLLTTSSIFAHLQTSAAEPAYGHVWCSGQILGILQKSNTGPEIMAIPRKPS